MNTIFKFSKHISGLGEPKIEININHLMVNKLYHKMMVLH